MNQATQFYTVFINQPKQIEHSCSQTNIILIFIYIYVHTYILICVCVCVYIYIYLAIYLSIYLCMYVYILFVFAAQLCSPRRKDRRLFCLFEACYICTKVLALAAQAMRAFCETAIERHQRFCSRGTASALPRARTNAHTFTNKHTLRHKHTRKQAERINGVHTCIRIPILAANRGPSPSVELQKFFKI